MKNKKRNKLPPMKEGKYVIKTLDDAYAVESELYPDGIEDLQTWHYFGFNLCRYTYDDLMAAELHAIIDELRGIVGYMYGSPFDPYVQTHTKEDGTEYYEVYTNI